MPAQRGPRSFRRATLVPCTDRGCVTRVVHAMPRPLRRRVARHASTRSPRGAAAMPPPCGPPPRQQRRWVPSVTACSHALPAALVHTISRAHVPILSEDTSASNQCVTSRPTGAGLEDQARHQGHVPRSVEVRPQFSVGSRAALNIILCRAVPSETRDKANQVTQSKPMMMRSFRFHCSWASKYPKGYETE